MANKTLLNAVNETFKRVQLIQGDSGLLTTLTDSARQIYIDSAVQLWNEAIDELYTTAEVPHPNELAESTITLVTSTRAYVLNASLIQLRFPLLDETNGRFIEEYPGGYMQLVIDQPFPANETGLANFAVIRPTDGYLYLDKIPTSVENGLVYKYRYDKTLELTAAASTVPFNDTVFRAMVPAVAELWKRNHQRDFDSAMYRASVGRASRLLTNKQLRESWLPVQIPVSNSDPFEAA